LAKREHKLVAFHGGFNDNSDPKDILDEEMRKADGVSSSRIGRLVTAGNIGNELTSLDDFTNTLKQGSGLFYFSTDRDSAEALSPEDWLAIYDSANGSNLVKLYYRDKDNSNAPGFYTAGQISFGNDSNKSDISFYYADGGLRMSDGNFIHNSKLHTFIDENLFQRSAVVTDDVLGLNKWVNVEQELKSFDSLSVVLDTFDASSGNPPTSQITAVNLSSAGRIVLAYWTDTDGDWNGTYQFASSPIYKGEQEGMLSIVPDTLNFYDNQVVFQVYVCLGQQDNSFSNFSDDAAHPLQDDRITGINWYFRTGADDDWTFLQKTDLLEGGKHHWKVYNADDNTGYGVFTGTVIIVDGNDDLNLGNKTGTNGSKTAPSYEETTITVAITNNTSNGFTGRYGFIRVWGGHTSPVWLNADGSGNPLPLTTATYSIPITTPGEGGREFRADILDENFTVIKTSDKINMDITDSGNEPSPTYSGDRS
jgi:hypothetical protein